MSTTLVNTKNDLFPSAFDDFFNGFAEWPLTGIRRKVTIPAVNVKETPDSYEISLAAPGLQKTDFRIDADAATLTITAAKEETKKSNEEKTYREEYNYASFSRSFSVPEDVNPEKIEATYINGVLTLTLPRKEKTAVKTAKQIDVK